MKDFNQMAAFIRVIQEGSFSKAALALGIPKSTLSHRVQELEKRLGVSLVQRTTRKLHLTPAGENYYRKGVLLLQNLDLLEDETREDQTLPQGSLKFTAPVEMGNFMLPPLVSEFRKLYPRIDLHFELTDRRVDLVGEGYDCALRGGALADSTLRARHVAQSEFGLFASPEYLRKAPPLESIEDLRLHDCLLFAPEASNEVVWRLVSKNQKREYRPSGGFRTNNLNLALKLALMGQGITTLPRFFGSPCVEDKTLVRVLPEWATRRSPISLVYPAMPYRSRRLEVFLDFMSARLRALTW